MNENLVCVITIIGESAIDMYSAGTEDLEDFFFPEKMGLKAEDVEVRFYNHAKDDFPQSEEKLLREVTKIISKE